MGSVARSATQLKRPKGSDTGGKIKIGGRVYQIAYRQKTKARAQEDARALREQGARGCSVRVLPDVDFDGKKCWAIFYREKGR